MRHVQFWGWLTVSGISCWTFSRDFGNVPNWLSTIVLFTSVLSAVNASRVK